MGGYQRFSAAFRSSPSLVREDLPGLAAKFESHEKFDYVYLTVRGPEGFLRPLQKIRIFLRPGVLLLFSTDNAALEEGFSELLSERGKEQSASKLLFFFLDRLTAAIISPWKGWNRKSMSWKRPSLPTKRAGAWGIFSISGKGS
jgi:SAM-dependent methyltransferase